MERVATETAVMEKNSGTMKEQKGEMPKNAEVNLPYSLEVCRELEQIVEQSNLLKHYKLSRYEVGDQLEYDLIGVCPDVKFKGLFEVEKFVGGGFAGQVYRVKLIQIMDDEAPVPEGIEIGQKYAIKILIPPSRFSFMFRNLIYWLAYQGPFSAQVQFSAARVGVLWQKLIRRGAKIYFNDGRSVVDTYATFYDKELDSYGEVNEWVTGRNWKFEIDDQIFQRKKWKHRDEMPTPDKVKSAEFIAKRKFMAKLVQLLHDMGAPELARQYEWGTMKSQPNALKRIDSDENDVSAITAIDFRAGLALLPFLPMSPADFKLIIKGLFRGNLVQFDRGNLKKLETFIQKNKEEFKDLMPAYEELLIREPQYRGSLPDITHHGFALLFKRSLQKSVKLGLIRGWESKELLDEEQKKKMSNSGFRFFFFCLLGILPFFGKLFRRLWGNKQYATHIKNVFTKWNYFKRALRAKQAHALIDWYRDGRVSKEKALKFVDRPFRFWSQKTILGWMPPNWHHFFTDGTYAWRSIKDTVTYPVRFYRDAEFREEWLLQNVNAGLEEGMLNEEEAAYIKNKIKDPFIQKYLKCVAVHVATLPITQVISVVAAAYAMIKFGSTWQEGLKWAGIVLAAFQATPVSPGSLVRGLYVLYLMIKERDFKNYWIAAMISFWHYVGYLGFPIQMVAKFPALSRLMAGRWATGIVHIIPVFGERGALLEHWVFDLFFNVPISVRRSFRKKEK